MTHPNYHQWPADAQAHYDKTAKHIEKYGHSIKGIKAARPFAYTVGASFSTGAEYLCFFPIKGKGFEIICGIMNKLIGLVQDGSLTLNSQIINDEGVYYLPIGMVALIDDVKDMAESKWAGQLQRDAFLAEFSTDDHQLFLLLFSDKDGNLPWEPGCGNFWPDICPPRLVAIAQEILTDDDFLMRKSKEDDDYYTTVRGVRYPLLAELSPQDMIEGYEMGVEEWTSRFPKGNYELLIATLTSMFKNEVVVTREGDNFIYFDINNIPESFAKDFPNDLFNPDDSLMRQLEEKLGIDEENPAEEPAADNEKEKELGREVLKKVLNDISDKHPDQKILELLVNGQKHIEKDEYELAIDTFSELIKVFGWENWSDEDQIIFKSGNLIWSKQGNDRIFPLFWAYYFRATAKYELAQYSEAISDYSTAIDIGLNIIKYDSDGEFTAASARSWTILTYNGRGLAKRSKDNYQDALDDFDEALKLCQEDDVHHKKQIYYNMGLTKKDMGDDEGAADAFTSSIELSPEEIDPYYWRGLSRYKIREHDGALDDFSHVIDNVKKEEHLDFDLKITYLYRGILRIKIDDNEGALQDLTKAIEIDPEFARAYFGRGIVKHLTGNNQGAVDDYTLAIKKGYKAPLVYKRRGEAKESMGDTKGAKEDFEKYEELKRS